ncbi:Fc.00g056300.m01.CDS01 [Cosmosporella sp. VM-42]
MAAPNRNPPFAGNSYNTAIHNAYNLLKNRMNQLLLEGYRVQRKNGFLQRKQRSLLQELEQASIDNSTIRSELQSQQANYDKVTGELNRITDEKTQIYEELESVKFQRELGELILDQHRDEILEQKKIIGEKEAHIKTGRETIAAAHMEISTLRAQVSYLRELMTVCEGNICSLRCQLESNVGKERQVISKLEKERNEAIDGCRYYQLLVERLKSTYDELEAKVDALREGSSLEQEAEGSD